MLYGESGAWKLFRKAAADRVQVEPSLFVGMTDIADFFPRIYHHRLFNALEAASGAEGVPYVRALDKMLSRFSDGVSYGIPIGPPASRVLAEAVLTDVDSTLLSFNIDFIRFVDDYVIFAPDPESAEFGLRVLGENLFLKHGLTLQTAKTKVLPAAEYVERFLTPHSEIEEERRHLFEIFGDSEYDVTPYEDLDEDQRREIDALNLSDMLRRALEEGENVDYAEVDFILRRLSSLRKPDLIPIVLENLSRLYPVADAVATFFEKFSDTENIDHLGIAQTLLGPVVNTHQSRASEFYCIWILSLFQRSSRWGNAATLLRIFREANSDAVRRFAALALAVSGSRGEAVTVREYLAAGTPLCRTAMLLATCKLGTDERVHMRRGLRLSDSLERICATAVL